MRGSRFTLRTAEPVRDIAIDDRKIVYSTGAASDCQAIERWRVGESRTYRREPRCPRQSSFRGIAATGDSVAWIVTTLGRRTAHKLSVAVDGHRARTIAGALGPAKRVGHHFGELAGDDDRLVFTRQRTVDPGEGMPFGAGWASFVYDGTRTHRIGAGGGWTGFGFTDGMAFRDGVVAVLWDAGTIVSLQRLGEARLRPLRLGAVPGPRDAAQSRGIAVDEGRLAVYDGATQLLRTFDVDTRRLLTLVRLRGEFAFAGAELVGLANGVVLFTHHGSSPPFLLVDVDDGRMATIAAPGIDCVNEERCQFADLDDDGAVIAYNTSARTWPGRIRFIPRGELLRLMLSAHR